MAEVFGVVGSAVGIAGFAFQIADGIKKLADFCHAVKDAPADIQNEILELEDLANLYQEMGGQINAQRKNNDSSLPSKTSLDKMLARCKRNLEELQTLLADMDTDIKKRRKRGSIKVVLKKETFSKFHRRVERSKDSLQLSYTVYCNTLMRQESQFMRTELQKISAVTPQISAMAPQIDILVTRSATNAPQEYYPNANVRQHQVIRPKHRRGRQTTTYKLQLPHWFFGRAYELAFYHSISGWDAQFRTYNIVSANSTFFDACYEADIESVKKLLASEPAHIFDRDPWGNDALSKVDPGRWRWDGKNQLQIVNLLLGNGADVNARNDSGFPCLSSYLCLYNGIDERTKTHEQLLDRSWFEARRDEDAYCFNRIAFCQDADSMFVELAKQHMTPPWSAHPLEERLNCLTRGDFKIYESTRKAVFESILESKLAQPVWEIVKRKNRKILLLIMCCYGRAVREGIPDVIIQWRAALNEARSLDVDLHRKIHDPDYSDSISAFPFVAFVRGYVKMHCETHGRKAKGCPDSCQENICQKAVVALASELKHLGFDLMESGPEIQEAIRGAQLANDSGCWDARFFRVVAMYYGPRPQDWHLLLSDLRDDWLEECVGDFWDMVEHPRMPGSWTEEAEGFEKYRSQVLRYYILPGMF